MHTVPPGAALYTSEYALLHYAGVSFTYNNKMKQFENYWYRVLKGPRQTRRVLRVGGHLSSSAAAAAF